MRYEEEIDRLLKEDGALLVRQGTHKVYRLSSGQMYTESLSPSDSRAAKNALSILRKLLDKPREIRKNPDRKIKQGVGRQLASFERPEDKGHWKGDLDMAYFELLFSQPREEEGQDNG